MYNSKCRPTKYFLQIALLVCVIFFLHLPIGEKYICQISKRHFLLKAHPNFSLAFVALKVQQVTPFRIQQNQSKVLWVLLCDCMYVCVCVCVCICVFVCVRKHKLRLNKKRKEQHKYIKVITSGYCSFLYGW